MKNKIVFPVFILKAVFIAMLLLISSAFAADLKLGEKVYKKKCLVCHGEQGHGGIALKINDPNVLRKTNEEIRKVITEGANGMPAYQNSLKPEEIDSLLTFLRSWAK